MKKTIQFSLVSILCVFLFLFTINVDYDIKSSLEKKELAKNPQISKEESNQMIKKVVLSLVAPYLNNSLNDAESLTEIDNEGFEGLPAICFAPDTNKSVVDEFYRNRTAIQNSLGLVDATRFNLASRWSLTSSNGGGLGQGDITTLTWSYVPDGTIIGGPGCGVDGELSEDPSNFIAFFNGIYGGPTTSGDFTTAPWHNVFVTMFNSWSNASGLIFVYEPNDDNAIVGQGGAAGILGVRGDIRVSGHRLDGNSNVLACNYFPNNGDMIIDTADDFYNTISGPGITNVLTHEIGHGLGIQHVCPINQTKLMEPFVTTMFTGPQQDDILATNRSYGDPEGLNDSPANASLLVATGNPTSYSKLQRSIDDNGDVDYFSFTTSELKILSGTLSPTGTIYLDGTQNGDRTCSAGSSFNALTVSDLMVEILNTDGVTVIAKADANGVGVNEVLTNVILFSAGTYYVRVKQQGSAINNVQMYDLTLSLEDPSTPEISFETISGNGMENSNCSFTDYNINIATTLGASADAEVTFSINGASTAIEGVDFDVLTASVTFPSGSNANQTMSLRVYEDGMIEGVETIVIDASLNANGGNATLNTAAGSYTFTIENDDVVPVSTITNSLYSEDFEDFSEWINTERTIDNELWLSINGLGGLGDFVARGIGSVTNDQFIGGPGNLYDPENYLISPAITVPLGATNTAFTYSVYGFQSELEYYTLRWTTDISNFTTIDAGQLIEQRFANINTAETRTVNMNNLEGQTGYFVVIHDNPSAPTNSNGLLIIDTVSIDVTRGASVQTAVNDGTTNCTININEMGSAYAVDMGGNIMLNFVNNDGFDYGCTDIAVSRAGIGEQPFNGSSLPDVVLDKTFVITPSNTTISGSNTTTFYFEQLELDAWLTATGLTVNDLVAGRVNGSIVAETSVLVVGSFGTNVTLTGDFTGLNGTYYFGTLNAFLSTCAGDTTTWDGLAWFPVAPVNTDIAIINGNYDTFLNGSINACELQINGNSMVVVKPNTYIAVVNDVTVTATASIIVEHQGSFVQVDAAALTINDGYINVEVTTPSLDPRDFMLIGSPMTTVERIDMSGFRLLNHNTAEFEAFIDTTGAVQDATNFLDADQNDWETYTGRLNSGEGYMYWPGPDLQTGGVFYFNFDKGTLRSGDVAYNTNFGIDKNDSPNVLSNPYASALDTDALITANNAIDEVCFWEHNSVPSNIYPDLPGNADFNIEDISLRNLGAGVASSTGGVAPTQFMSTAQGFGFKAATADPVVFTNAMRVTGNNNTLRNPLVADRLWLNVQSATYSNNSNLVIVFTDAATAGVDVGYDTHRLATGVSMYTQISDEQGYAIQTREAFTNGVSVTAGFSSMINENEMYTITITDRDGGNMIDASIYLIDHVLNSTTDLAKSSYTFESVRGNFPGRFTILFENNPVLGDNDVIEDSVSLYPNPVQDTLTVVSSSAISNIIIIDLSGRIVQSIAVNALKTQQVNLSSLASNIYFVRVESDNGVLIKRIIKK